MRAEERHEGAQLVKLNVKVVGGLAVKTRDIRSAVGVAANTQLKHHVN